MGLLGYWALAAGLLTHPLCPNERGLVHSETALLHPLMCAWEKVSTESTELANKNLDEPWVLFFFMLSIPFRCVLMIQQKRRNNCFFHGPLFLLVHQDWLFFSRQKYKHGQANAFRVIFTKGSNHWKDFSLQCQQSLGMEIFLCYSLRHCNHSQRFGKDKSRDCQTSDLSKQP